MLSYSKSLGFLGDFDFLFEKHLIGRLPRISVNSQSKCNSSKEAALSAKNSSINFKKKAKNNKKGG